jgi:putative chitinase
MAGLDADGDRGPKTRAALHKALLALSGATTQKQVVPQAVEATVKKKFNLLGWVSGAFGGGGFGIAALAGFDWRALIVIIGFAAVLTIGVLIARKWVISAIKDIRLAVEN